MRISLARRRYMESPDHSATQYIEFFNGCSDTLNLYDWMMLFCHDGCFDMQEGSDGLPSRNGRAA